MAKDDTQLSESLAESVQDGSSILKEPTDNGASLTNNSDSEPGKTETPKTETAEPTGGGAEGSGEETPDGLDALLKEGDDSKVSIKKTTLYPEIDQLSAAHLRQGLEQPTDIRGSHIEKDGIHPANQLFDPASEIEDQISLAVKKQHRPNVILHQRGVENIDLFLFTQCLCIG